MRLKTCVFYQFEMNLHDLHICQIDLSLSTSLSIIMVHDLSYVSTYVYVQAISIRLNYFYKHHMVNRRYHCFPCWTIFIYVKYSSHKLYS